MFTLMKRIIIESKNKTIYYSYVINIENVTDSEKVANYNEH